MMRITCNRDEIVARMHRYYSAIDEEKIEIEKCKFLESEISKLKNELWHAQNGVILAGRIQNSCMDDVAWLQQFNPNDKQCDSDAYLNTEITKGWRNRK